ncbi:bifunctional tRNA (5-methylaminomethyl-2-thiouridine)(34)-methyltransferase MnmD/FAD-dependent 5-carboxymethylaminomethyl-2-thiouridine(34) oxidoreductase MnmC [Wenzhouxiangella marina]|uniref:tRNA 5-methylaminomethyl-2-thiouridine biosynthesis bifunctional protein MnmC n=1 Tax=Wenzhouxiangella marina TaxID=1579979 RepID=A0A0K0XSU6_9GAMM|nr:bifunctional tRNA (5-methylaminomethyl-2-thiouridine)(34)-methyltransferase MnmD/FAD-dependent 5-carboxymethylaminomethyl-2-thiouridine(34) oxidoreductase MnmC [Wenzhouxiangella marina]AKS40730.1 D-amino acid oxidase family protein [Wenzhouxiangella marina]MBB6087603.1 tRNA 5-methylaminomethyl-2-thiouridine biosynthesis bifunctional protein [Wenzhouxiangella marina]
MKPTAQPIRPAEIDFQGQTPHSSQFDDGYFMPEQGLRESLEVFIQANQLAERFARLPRMAAFVIGETGFGTGLNCLLAARCFLEHAPPDARLQIFSVEKHPLRQSALDRSLSAWPELGGLTKRLLEFHPPPVPGYHRLALHERVELILMYGEAESTWSQARMEVDAWFLDGFAPSRNPAMWTSGLFRALARCSRPGASFGTFTAAGQVRRGLAEAGFEVERVAGFAGKRHRLLGRWPGRWQARHLYRGEALVAGAGLAGATTARALAERGWRVRVIDRSGPANGASGNRAGVLYTTPSPHLTAQNRFYQTAFVRAGSWFRGLGFPAGIDQGRLNGVLQIATSDRHRRKLEAAIDSGAWPPEMLEATGQDRFLLHGGGYLSPPHWCQALLDHPAIEFERAELRGFDGGPRALLADGRRLDADALVLCLAHATAELPGLDWLFIKRIRGQVSEVAASLASRDWQRAICHGGYLTPALDGRHCVGATFDLNRPDHGLDPGDDRANLEQLRAFLPDHWQALGGEAIEVIGQRVAVRCQSPDFLPQAGALPDPGSSPHGHVDGVYLNLGHGSRGLTHTPLVADLLAAGLSREMPSVEPELVDALAPERFVLRQRRRQPDWQP